MNINPIVLKIFGEQVTALILFVLALVILYGARERRDYMLAGVAVPYFLEIVLLEGIFFVPGIAANITLRAEVARGILVMLAIITAMYALNGRIETLLDAAYRRGVERMGWQEPVNNRKEIILICWVIWYGVPSIAGAFARATFARTKNASRIVERWVDAHKPQ